MSARQGYEIGDALVTGMLADDHDAVFQALCELPLNETTRECLLYLAGSVASLWEQSSEDPRAEWAECLLIRAAGGVVDG